MIVRNLTPHPIRFVGAGRGVVLDPERPTPRSAEACTRVGEVEVSDLTVPMYEVWPGPVCDLPAESRGVLLIVSRVVAGAIPDRRDLVVPHDLVRDNDGNVVGCRALARLSLGGEA